MATKPGWELFSLQGLVPELSRGWRAAEQDGAGGNLPHQTAGAVGQKLHGTAEMGKRCFLSPKPGDRDTNM